jgi:hypothetical protein
VILSIFCCADNEVLVKVLTACKVTITDFPLRLSVGRNYFISFSI